MEDDPVALSRSAFEALDRGDLEAFLERVDPEVEFNSLVAEADSGVFRGHEGVREWWAMIRESVGGMRFEVERIERTEHPRVAMVLINVVGEVRGVEVGQRMWQVVYAPGDKATWWGVFRTEEEALRAGLEAAERG